jgi:hypothetical protein
MENACRALEEDDVTTAYTVYHERQSRQLCALHVLNNLFQEPKAFVQGNLDVICHQVCLLGPAGPPGGL